MKEEEMLDIADLLAEALSKRDDPDGLEKMRGKVRELTRRFPLPT
jgi:glycine/serine hydroxymethyltransferase